MTKRRDARVLRYTGAVIALGALALLPWCYAATGGSAGRFAGRQLAEVPQGLAPEQVSEFAVRQPFSADAFLWAGREAAEAGDPVQAKKLVTQAVRLNPRLFEARLWMAQDHLASGRTVEGVREIATLFRLRPGSGAGLHTILADAARDPAIRPLLADTFRNTPDAVAIASQAATLGLDPEGVLQILQGTNFDALPEGRAAAQGKLIAPYVQRQEHREAYALWRALLASKHNDRIFNGSFAPVEASPPFGWKLTSNADIQAAKVESSSPATSTALRVEPYADLPSTAVEQHLILQPGTYDLRYDAMLDGSGSGLYEWRLQCLSGKLIGRRPIDAGRSWSDNSWRLQVPAECPVQVLQLRASSPAGRAPALLVSNVRL